MQGSIKLDQWQGIHPRLGYCEDEREENYEYKRKVRGPGILIKASFVQQKFAYMIHYYLKVKYTFCLFQIYYIPFR